MTETAMDYPSFDAAAVPAHTDPDTGEEAGAGLERLRDVSVELAVEIGRTRMTIGQALALGPGAFVTLDRLAGEPVDLLVNGRLIARGELVLVDGQLGVTLTELLG